MNGMRAFSGQPTIPPLACPTRPWAMVREGFLTEAKVEAILTLALRGSWSQAVDGLIGLVADVQPPTGPAGLGWGLQCTALLGKNCDREDGLGSPRSALPLLTSGPI